MICTWPVSQNLIVHINGILVKSHSVPKDSEGVKSRAYRKE